MYILKLILFISFKCLLSANNNKIIENTLENFYNTILLEEAKDVDDLKIQQSFELYNILKNEIKTNINETKLLLFNNYFLNFFKQNTIKLTNQQILFNYLYEYSILNQNIYELVLENIYNNLYNTNKHELYKNFFEFLISNQETLPITDIKNFDIITKYLINYFDMSIFYNINKMYILFMRLFEFHLTKTNLPNIYCNNNLVYNINTSYLIFLKNKKSFNFDEINFINILYKKIFFIISNNYKIENKKPICLNNNNIYKYDILYYLLNKFDYTNNCCVRLFSTDTCNYMHEINTFLIKQQLILNPVHFYNIDNYNFASKLKMNMYYENNIADRFILNNKISKFISVYLHNLQLSGISVDKLKINKKCEKHADYYIYNNDYFYKSILNKGHVAGYFRFYDLKRNNTHLLSPYNIHIILHEMTHYLDFCILVKNNQFGKRYLTEGHANFIPYIMLSSLNIQQMPDYHDIQKYIISLENYFKNLDNSKNYYLYSYDFSALMLYYLYLYNRDFYLDYLNNFSETNLDILENKISNEVKFEDVLIFSKNIKKNIYLTYLYKTK